MQSLCFGGGIGRHAGLKILWAAMSVRVRFPSEAQGRSRTESLMVSRPAFIFVPDIPFKVNIPSKQQAQPDSCCGRDSCGHGCSVMAVRSWLLRTWLLRLNHTISSYHHIIPPCHTELRPHTFIAVHIAALIAAIKVGCITLLCIPRPSSRLGRLPRGFPVIPLRRFPVALCSAM